MSFLLHLLSAPVDLATLDGRDIPLQGRMIATHSATESEPAVAVVIQRGTRTFHAIFSPSSATPDVTMLSIRDTTNLESLAKDLARRRSARKGK